MRVLFTKYTCVFVCVYVCTMCEWMRWFTQVMVVAILQSVLQTYIFYRKRPFYSYGLFVSQNVAVYNNNNSFGWYIKFSLPSNVPLYNSQSSPSAWATYVLFVWYTWYITKYLLQYTVYHLSLFNSLIVCLWFTKVYFKWVWDIGKMSHKFI